MCIRDRDTYTKLGLFYFPCYFLFGCKESWVFHSKDAAAEPSSAEVRTPGIDIRTLLYSLSLCWAEVMAERTDNRFTRDLMFDAVPYSSANIFVTRVICMSGWIQFTMSTSAELHR